MIWELEVENIRRVGPIEIGIDKAQIHELLGSPSRSFRRTQDVQEPSDHYEKDGDWQSEGALEKELARLEGDGEIISARHKGLYRLAG